MIESDIIYSIAHLFMHSLV